LSNPKQVNKFLKKIGLDPTNMRDKTKLRKVLEATYNYIANSNINSFKEILTQSFLDELIGFQDERQVMFNNFIKKMYRFKKPEDFYKYYEKEFKYIATEMIKKISKVYSLTER
jgi:methionine synthase II (cobalamin-independent)